MAKQYKTSFKIFSNTRLKRVEFHKQSVNPLYIRVIHSRKPIDFKSFYFDLLAHPKYIRSSGAKKLSPNLELVIKEEEALLHSVIQSMEGEFSLEDFVSSYRQLALDLITLMEDLFFDFLQIFMADEGYSTYSAGLSNVGQQIAIGNLLKDFKSIWRPNLYQKMVENAAFLAPPYIPLFDFADREMQKTFPIFSVNDWLHQGLRDKFVDFLSKYYPAYDTSKTVNAIDSIASPKN